MAATTMVLPMRSAAVTRLASATPTAPAARPVRVLDVQHMPTQLSLFGRHLPAPPPGRARTA